METHINWWPCAGLSCSHPRGMQCHFKHGTTLLGDQTGLSLSGSTQSAGRGAGRQGHQLHMLPIPLTHWGATRHTNMLRCLFPTQTRPAACLPYIGQQQQLSMRAYLSTPTYPTSPTPPSTSPPPHSSRYSTNEAAFLLQPLHSEAFHDTPPPRTLLDQLLTMETGTHACHQQTV